MKLLTTNTSTGAASSNFTADIDSTYKLFIFKWYDVNPATDSVHMEFNGSTDGGSNYNVTKTTTHFRSYLFEGGSGGGVDYQTGYDRAQSTSHQVLGFDIGNQSDESTAGELFLFNPSSSTFIKHFYATALEVYNSEASVNSYVAGYLNTTSPITAIQFKMNSGNMDGVIKLYGVG